MRINYHNLNLYVIFSLIFTSSFPISLFGFKAFFSDVFLVAIILVITVKAFYGKITVDSNSLIITILIILFFISSLVNNSINTPLLNNIKNYAAYIICYVYIINIIKLKLLDSLITPLLMASLLHITYGYYAISEIWSESIKLYTYDSENYQHFNLNNWGFACSLLMVFTLVILEKANSLSKKDNAILLFTTFITFSGALISLSRSAIVISLIGIMFFLLSGKITKRKIFISLFLVTSFTLILMNFDFNQSEQIINATSNKFSNLFNDVVDTRLYSINIIPIMDFFNQGNILQIFIGQINQQQHSSIPMSLYYGGIFGLLLYLTFVANNIRSKKMNRDSAIKIFITLIFITNELLTNAIAYYPTTGFIFFILLATLKLTQASTNHIKQSKSS